MRKYSTASYLSHVDSSGHARQVDVSSKSKSIRTAIARGSIKVTPEVSKLITENRLKKGDVLTVAKIASIMGAKQVSNLIPLCHPICLDFADCTIEHDREKCEIIATTTARCTGNTGVEMEALTSCSIALLTIYDMCKSVTQQLTINDIRLIHKSGGKTNYDYSG